MTRGARSAAWKMAGLAGALAALFPLTPTARASGPGEDPDVARLSGQSHEEETALKERQRIEAAVRSEAASAAAEEARARAYADPPPASAPVGGGAQDHARASAMQGAQVQAAGPPSQTRGQPDLEAAIQSAAGENDTENWGDRLRTHPLGALLAVLALLALLALALITLRRRRRAAAAGDASA